MVNTQIRSHWNRSIKSEILPNCLTQSVLQVYNNSVCEVTDEASIVQRLGGRASYEVPTMDPHHDRQRAPQGGAEVHIYWDKDVEVETVLTDLFGTLEEILIQLWSLEIHIYNQITILSGYTAIFHVYGVYLHI